MIKCVLRRYCLVAFVLLFSISFFGCSGGGGGGTPGDVFVSGNLECAVESINGGDPFIVINGPAPGTGAHGSFTLDIPSEINGIPVEDIEDFAFSDNLALTSVRLREGVRLGYDCFAGCANLTSVELPDSMTYLYDGAFANCTSLESINLPSSLRGIGNHSFAGCTKLSSITIPSGVTTIYPSAFAGCTSLRTVVLPEGLTTVYAYIFAGCTSLTEARLPSTVTSIDDEAFRDCSSLRSVYIMSSNPPDLGREPFSGNHADRYIYVKQAVLSTWTSDPGWVAAGYSGALRALP